MFEDSVSNIIAKTQSVKKERWEKVQRKKKGKKKKKMKIIKMGKKTKKNKQQINKKPTNYIDRLVARCNPKFTRVAIKH